ncbi:glycosyltransferase [Neisseria animalis]|uniref:Glycosyltransferase n=1 Tax=Neisseria animalis TaxID=492 RepID=A0A5P3MSN3_NEIAN|nr:glycosyltransferase [Neisseria animalis]QEY24584.1 glycosyltransferase [Neisseria animalis]ROW33002.1 glycosyltransferase [Neisseria animalis]VEE07421.1 Glycosyl transferase family 2 [Neisseria animalis]
MSTICLNMIVKNEAEIIEETLCNILEYIPLDYWVIADTGSTDDTPERICRFFAEKGIKGELVHHEWKHFGHNRQLAMEAAHGKADYLFFFDADDRLVGDINLKPSANLVSDAYFFKMRNQYSTDRFYTRRLLIKNDPQWKWRGAVHEQLHIERPSVQTLIEGDYHVVSGRFGARSQNPKRYYEDALMLEKYFSEDDDRVLCAQNAFFCAQSYRDAKMHEKAAEWYAKSLNYADAGSEHRRYTLMSLAGEYVRLGQIEKAVYQWQLAFDNSPENAESLVHLAEHFLSENASRLALVYAEQSLPLKLPSLQQSIAVDEVVYNYGRHNAYLRASIALNQPEKAYSALRHLLQLPELKSDLNLYLLEALLLEPMKQRYLQDTPEMQAKIHEQIAAMQKFDNDQAKAWQAKALAWLEEVNKG